METRETGSTTERMADGVKGTAREIATTAKDVAQSRAQGVFESGKQTAVHQMEGVAQAIRSASSELGGQGRLSETVRTFADRIERFSRTLDEREFTDLLHEAEGYARREPAIFLGGAFALGFALSRFLKASAERRSGTYAGSGSYAGAGSYAGTAGEPAGLGGPSYL